jgi:antitoxin component YwqK of YwqJK toxin-antitoxin module
MKKRIFNYLMLLSVMIVSNTIVAQESIFDPYKIEVEYFSDGGVKDGLIFNDKKGDTYKIKNSDYNKGLYLKYDGKFLKHGVFYSMSNGRVTSKTSYYYGKKHGEHLGYHSNGKIQFQYYYDNGKKNGKWYQYRDDESLFEEKEYKMGVLDGVKITYHSNGIKNFERTYINGLREGDTLQYNDKGKLVGRTKYKMGKRVGKTQWTH